MRIAFATSLFPPEFEGGTERVVRAHARGLAQRGHSVLVLSGSDAPHDGRNVIWDRDGAVEIARLPRLASEPWDLELARPRLEQLAARLAEGADVVHLHHWTTLSSGLAQALAAEHAVVLTLHDAFSSCARYFRRPPDPAITCPRGDVTIPCVRCLALDAPHLTEAEIARALDARRWAFAGEIAAASALIAPSRFQAQRMERALALEPGRIQVVPHGLCRELSPPAVARADWDRRAPLRVLHFGNLVEAKGILALVRTLASLPRGAVELDLAGTLLEPQLAQAVEAERGELAVRWSGPLRSRSLAELGARAHLAAFPSLLDETYGLVLDEAAALGLPLWVSDRGALPERLAELGGGRALPAGDVPAWRRAFEEVLARPAALAEERARLAAPHGPQAAVARLETLYGGLSAARP
jgi:glycosyltransferase involved in cell wall biosynthesis